MYISQPQKRLSTVSRTLLFEVLNGQGIDIDPADFVQCENELLSIREDRK